MNRLILRLLSGKAGARFELRILMRQTAGVFGVDGPATAGRSAPELLRDYARLTASAAACAIESGQDLKLLERKLYHMARRLGSILRWWMRPVDERECFAILRLLYRNIGITIREAGPGEYRVSKCYFSSFYTPEICSVISAIDRGIFAGIYHGGRLVFRGRITEGDEVCRAGFGKGSPVRGSAGSAQQG